MTCPDKLYLSILILLVHTLSGAAFAQKPSYPAYVGHVNDFANVIDPATEQRLETILTNFEHLTGTQIAAVVVQSLNDRPIEEYAEELYETWGIGAKSGANKSKGALLLVSLGDRKTRLEVGYGLEGDLPDGLAGEIIRRMRPDLQQARYSQALEVGVRSIVDTLAEKWNVDLAGIDRRFAYRAPARTEAPGSKAGLLMMGIFFLFIIVIMSIVARKSRRGRSAMMGRRGIGAGDLWWLAPIIFNRGGGSFGGGSWDSNSGWGGGGSGSSSGGSDWSGFGGGESGGGGASDSW